MSSSRIEIKSGETIFSEGEEPTIAYLIEAGEIELSRQYEGHKRIIGVCGPGDLVGEMAVIDTLPRLATAVALIDCVLVAIDREQIQARIDAADPIVQAIVRKQLQRYRSVFASPRIRGDGQIPQRENGVVDEHSAIGKIRLESQLKDAIAQRRLEIVFQPILDIPADRICGFEALVRWPHQELGIISPAEFIKLAEETSLILPVGRFVFDEVCQALKALVARGAGQLPFFAINISAKQALEDGLIDEMQKMADLHQVPVNALKIEITESLAMDAIKLERLMTRCRALGIKVALDDFGTGFSNLSYLHQLHFDMVKIDKSFVAEMLSNPRCYAVVEAIANLVKAWDGELVAEGVENPEQIAALKQLGCRYAQGFLIGKPMDKASMLALSAPN